MKLSLRKSKRIIRINQSSDIELKVNLKQAGILSFWREIFIFLEFLFILYDQTATQPITIQITSVQNALDF